MHHCGVSATRALSLVASETDKVMRPWYSNKAREVKIPSVENVPIQFRKMLVAQYLERFKNPDVMRYVDECCVCSSFVYSRICLYVFVLKLKLWFGLSDLMYCGLGPRFVPLHAEWLRRSFVSDI